MSLNKIREYSQLLKVKRKIQTQIIHDKYMCFYLKSLYQNDLKSLIFRLDELEKEVKEELNKIEDEFILKIVKNHYIDGISWEKISKELKYAYSPKYLAYLSSLYFKKNRS